MTSTKTNIFLTGATGYVGGSLLQRLLSHPKASTFAITTLVRNAEKAKAIAAIMPDVNVVAQHPGQYDQFETLSEQSHVVLHVSHSDDVEMIQATLRGLRKRHAATGDVPILIHTSGTGVLIDDAHGMSASDVIYDDTNTAQIEALPPTAIHRAVDTLVADAGKEGYVRTHIVIPATIYGIAHGPLYDAGISNRHSHQIPTLIRAAFRRKQAGVVGAGKAIWGALHLDDVVELYIVLLDAIVERPAQVPHGRAGHFFAENGEYTWLQASEKIGEALVALGVAPSAAVTPFAPEELVPLFGSEWMAIYFGTNSRCRATNARALGWAPRRTTADLLASIGPEAEALWAPETRAA